MPHILIAKIQLQVLLPPPIAENQIRHCQLYFWELPRKVIVMTMKITIRIDETQPRIVEGALNFLIFSMAEIKNPPKDTKINKVRKKVLFLALSSSDPPNVPCSAEHSGKGSVIFSEFSVSLFKGGTGKVWGTFIFLIFKLKKIYKFKKI